MKQFLSQAIKAIILTAPLYSSAALAESGDNALHIYNWSDYIGESTIANFEKETGIDVVYDTYDSYEAAQGKLLAGRSGYDLVLLDASMAPRLIKAEIFQPLDHTKLSNWQNLEPTVLKNLEIYDPSVKYSFPYTWGTTGVTYNVDMVKERMGDAPVDSMALVFDPEVVSKFAECGVTLLDSPSDIYPMALSYLGLPPNSDNKADIQAAEQLLKSVRPYIKKFDSTAYMSDLPNKENCISMSWSGDYATTTMRAEEAGIDINLKYFVPKEGAPMWFDAFYMPSDAPHVDNAHKFIDYMLRPEVIAETSNYIAYANANAKAGPHMDPAIANDPAIYPDEATMSKLFSKETKEGKAARLLTRSWSSVKTGQ